MIAPALQRFRFGNAIAESSVPLACVLPVEPSASTAHRIRIDWAVEDPSVGLQFEQRWTDGEDVLLSLAHVADSHWLRVPGMADFLLTHGHAPEPARIGISSTGRDLPAETLEHLLLDQILPRSLAQQGQLVIHASAVQVGNRIALFAAASGWGKSTLAALLHRHGMQVLSDDCIVLDIDDGQVHAVPTYPSLRLLPESIEALHFDADNGAPVSHYSTKQRLDVPLSAHEPAPVIAIFLLNDPATPATEIRVNRVHASRCCVAIIRNSFRLDLGDRAGHAHHLAQCSEVARIVPAFDLHYPRDFSQQDALVACVRDHLERLARSRGEAAR